MGTEPYEFDASGSQLLATTARWMGVLGWAFMVAGVLVGLPVFAGKLLFLPAAVFLIVGGLLTVRASRSFGLVASTEGRDVDHLLDAIDALRRLYRMQVLTVGVAILIAGGIAFLGYLAS